MDTELYNPDAFPKVAFDSEGMITSNYPEYNGMTLRDYFANSIIQSYVKEHLERLRENVHSFTVEEMVDSSYVIADAMLKQRAL